MRTQKQIEANYTGLVHAGEGIEIEKGKISARGGSGGTYKIVDTVSGTVHNLDKTWNEIMAAATSGLIPYVVQEIEGIGTVAYLTVLEIFWDDSPKVIISISGESDVFAANDGDSSLSYDTGVNNG